MKRREKSSRGVGKEEGEGRESVNKGVVCVCVCGLNETIRGHKGLLRVNDWSEGTF